MHTTLLSQKYFWQRVTENNLNTSIDTQTTAGGAIGLQLVALLKS